MPRRSPLPVLFLTVFLDLLGFGMIIPLQPLLAAKLGASGLEVGLLMAAYSGMQFLFAPVWGRLSDRVGRRPVLLGSIAGNVVAMLIFALARSLPVLFLARLLAGVAAANLGTAQAYVADVTPPEGRARGMGVVGAALGLGFVLGPAMGGALSRGGWALPGLVAAGLSLVNLALAFWLLPESLGPEARRALPFRRSRLAGLNLASGNPLVGLLFALFFAVTFGFSQMEATFSLFTLHRFGYGPAASGYLFTLIGVVLAVVQGGFIGPLQRRFGEAWLLLAATILIGSGLLVLGEARNLPVLLASCALLALGQGLHMPSLSGLLSRQAPAGEQGVVLGTNQAFGSLARVLGPIAGGLAFDVGETAPFRWSAGVLGVAVLLAWRVVLQQRRAVSGGALADGHGMETDAPRS